MADPVLWYRCACIKNWIFFQPMNTTKCDLCKEAAFVQTPGRSNAPMGWEYVQLGTPVEGSKLLICPFCCAVARALQAADQTLASSGSKAAPAPESVRPGGDQCGAVGPGGYVCIFPNRHTGFHEDEYFRQWSDPK
jgi:hypothetical protein